MQIIYDRENLYIKIAIDYDDVEAMNRLCDAVIECSNSRCFWQVQGIYLNHALDEKDILESQKKLEHLFSKKGKCMNVTKMSGKLTDCILLSKEEVKNYFADFAICYMEIIVTAQDNDIDILEFGTDSDSSYVYIKKKNSNNSSTLRLLQQVGIEQLHAFICGKNDLVWNDDIFESVGKRYPEINAFLEYKILALKEDGWTIQEEYVKNCSWKKKKRLMYHLSKANNEVMDMPILNIQYQHRNSSLVITAD